VNNVKTFVLLVALSALLVWVGAAFGGRQGATLALVVTGAMNIGAYWFSDRMILARYGAKPVTEAEAPELYGIAAELAQRDGMPMPRVYVIPSESPNAFATGRSPSHAAIAATVGILRILDRDELRAVLAHELSHVKHRDTLISSVAATLAGAITWLASMARWGMLFGGGRDSNDRGTNPLTLLVVTIFAGLGATLIQLAVSRSREYEADAGGARLVGDGEALARALEKLDAASRAVPMDASPATAHLFIVNPLAGARGSAASVFARMFGTHPPTAERIARLRDRSWAR
jgi:heat shock protein HtpX